MITVSTFAEAREACSGRVALVPTMGFFHEGHLSLMEAAREMGDTLAVSLFVNPLQFEDPDDLGAYPRDPERDAALAAEVGVDVLFVPPTEEMYPLEPLTRVVVSRLTERMEGAHRPGHFEGVATVVTKLFAGLQPDVAVFGRKDAQQLAVVTRLAIDLSLPVEVVGRPLVREPDGLALSSRNVRIEDREAALGLSRGLFAAAEAVEAGERDAAILEGIAAAEAAGVDLEYAELASADEAQPISRIDQTCFLAVAGRVGSVRLIDNLYLDVVDGEVAPDRGIRLDRPSVLYGPG